MTDKKVMAVGAHCDDVEFMCGGTLLKCHDKLGYEILYVQSTNNMSGGWSKKDGNPAPPPGTYKKELVEVFPGRFSWNLPWFIEMPQRKKEAFDIATAYFDTEPIFLDYPQRHYKDSNLNKIDVSYGSPRPDCVPENVPTILTAHDHPEEVAKVTKLILENNPEVIITHAPVDYTEEHTSTCHLIRKAFLKAKAQGYDGSLIYALPVTLGQYGDFFDHCDTWVDTTGFEEKKREVLGHHYSQIPYPERLDLEDVPRGKKLGTGAADTYYIFELSKSENGELTAELKIHRGLWEIN